MKGDFSRRSAARDPSKRYTAVLHQQGRVWLDSDWNEEVFESQHVLEQESSDIIGKSGIPEPGTAFLILPNPIASPNAPGDFLIGGGPGNQGRAYVDGVLCHLSASATYLSQPDLPNPPPIMMPSDGGDLNAVVYLEVWQRLITSLEDADVREVALAGPDTTARIKTVAQVKVAIVPNSSPPPTITRANADQFLPIPGRGTLTTLQPQTLPSDLTDQCRLPDPANFTGRQNCLYRVEIHEGGDVVGNTGASTVAVKLGRDVARGATSLPLAQGLTGTQIDAVSRWGFLSLSDDDGNSERVIVGTVSDDGLSITLSGGLQNAYRSARNATLSGAARFKWSRDNASFAVQVTAVAADRRTLTLASLGRDQATALRQGDLVEFSDDMSELGPARGHLTNLVSDPDPDQLTVLLADPLPLSFQLPGAQGATRGSPSSSPPTALDRHPVLRRWDGTGIAQATFVAGQTLDKDLGDGVQIQFGGADLLPGDYWQFAARSADGSVEQLTNAPPGGILRHRCPLAIVRWSSRPLGSPPGSPPSGYTLAVVEDCRQVFPSLVDAPRTQAGLHIAQVSVGDPASGQATLLFNDTPILVPQLVGGLNILCDAPVDPASITRTTCFVTVEVPFTVGISTSPPLTELAGYQPLVLGGTTTTNDRLISWRPTPDAAATLPALASSKPDGDPGILARLTLKGNLIWSQDRQLFLDGEAFALAQSGVITLSLPSGDRRRGGDFEMWFWLNAQPVALADLELSATLAFVGDTVGGTLTLSGPAPATMQIVPTSSAPNIASVSGPVQFAPGTAQATFTVVAHAVGSATIAASFGGASLSVPLTTALRPVTLTSLDLPRSILRGDSTTGTITLSSAAQAGSVITITSTVPNIVSISSTTIRVPTGATTASFDLTGTATGQTQIVAAMGNSSVSILLSVRTKFKDKDKDRSKDNKDKDKDKDHSKEAEIIRQARSVSPSSILFDGTGLGMGSIVRPPEGTREIGGDIAVARAFIRPDERPPVRPLLPQAGA